MRNIRAWLLRMAGVFRRDRWNAEIDDELASHMELEIADYERGGMTPEEARRRALLRMGGFATVHEAYRDRSTIPTLEHVAADLRRSVRQLVKRPGYSITAGVVLTLGMAACAAIFAFVDAALIQPLPYSDPGRLVFLAETSEAFPLGNISYADFIDWRQQQTAFNSMNAFTGGSFLMTTNGRTDPIRAGLVTAGFFRTLGVNPMLGRNFLNSDDVPGAPGVILLSYNAWEQKFGGRRNVLGQRILLSGDAYTILGVLPPQFQFSPLSTPEFWMTINTPNQCEAKRGCHNLFAVGRLKPGISRERAATEMSAIAARLEKLYPDTNRGRGAGAVSLSERIVGHTRPILLILLGGAALLLFIAYVNVASLILVRSEGRRREMAVRTAMGASVTRLVCQFAAEAAVLSAAATIAALTVTEWLTHALKALIPTGMVDNMPFLMSADLNGRVAAYCILMGAVGVLLFTTTALLHLRFSKVSDALADGSRGSAARAWRRIGSRLVVVELATAMVLLMGAMLLGKSLYRLLHVDIGFRPDHLVLLQVGGPDSKYGKPEQGVVLAREIIQKVESLPGVKSAALSTGKLVTENGNTDWIRIVGKPYNGKHNEVNERDVSARFFGTIGARLLRGRLFTEQEDSSKPQVVVINEALAKKYFPNEDPIGKQLGGITLDPKSIKTIVGVVDDIREGSLDSDIWPAEYHPLNQDPNDYFELFAHTAQNPVSALPEMERAVRSVHSDLGVRDVDTMEHAIENSPSADLHRSCASLVGGFAITALLLSIVGLYGVIAYSVSQRTREIGVRMALGAEHRTVYAMVVREAGRLAMLGVVIGAGASIMCASFAKTLLFGVTSWDPQSIAAVALILGVAALTASFIPARRAASVNPLEALRAE